MYTDSHCHLNFPELAEQLDAVLAAMHGAKVTRALCISTQMETFAAVLGLAQNHPQLWCTVGVHPDEEHVHEPSLSELLQHGRQAKVLAVGETGLDYYQMETRKGGRTIAHMEWQRERFRTHIAAARSLGKPLVIHTRNAAEDTLAILRECGEGTGGPTQAGGVFHCFTDDLAVAKRVLDMDYYLSFSGIVTFKTAQSLRAVAAYVPQERMLIETDSPYLAPVPHRGKINTPAYVPLVAQQLAQVRGVSPEQIAQQTSANFDTLFIRTAHG